MSVTLPKNEQRGFTIVEILIVIVVIAILAAISIVAYNGIQNRAHNSSLYAGIDAYHKAIKLYAIDNGAYPPQIPACFGGNATLGANGDQCITTATTYKINTGFDNAIKGYMGGTTPKMPLKTVTGTFSGTTYNMHTSGTYGMYNSKPSLYYYPIDTNCRSGEADVTSYSFANAKACIVLLPDL